ncbi:unnamed protein product [Ceratitis capitata]|uniref:(Mediterranean fruit fly) hypothetical protein n=1 Tax=Ceratitis capitata TaxID=7213 RepID=A0A811V2L3_CERCA|nr:unnamed protein product [Ceratitis capitata]
MSNAFTELQFTSEPHTKACLILSWAQRLRSSFGLKSTIFQKGGKMLYLQMGNTLNNNTRSSFAKTALQEFSYRPNTSHKTVMSGRSLTANFVMNSNLFLAKKVLKLISTSNIKYVGTTQCNLYNEINSTATHGLHTQVHTHTLTYSHIFACNLRCCDS